jgi:hypothetical protein
VFAPRQPIWKKAEEDKRYGEGNRGDFGGIAMREAVKLDPVPRCDGLSVVVDFEGFLWRGYGMIVTASFNHGSAVSSTFLQKCVANFTRL